MRTPEGRRLAATSRPKSTLLLLAFASTCANAAPNLSDRDARALVDKFYAENERWDVPVGSLAVVSDGHNWAKGRLDKEGDAIVRAAAQAGFVSVTVDSTYEQYRQGKGFSWDQFHQQSQQAILSKYVVAALPLGRSECKRSASNPTWLDCLGERAADVQLVENKEKRVGASEYRFVLAKARFEFSPLAKAYFALLAEKDPTAHRCAHLFKWDAFEKQWQRTLSNCARGPQRLDTSKIDRVLRGAE